MGCNDWLELENQNNSGKILFTRNLYVHWGKQYANQDKFKDVGEDTSNSRDIGSNDLLSFASCSRENALSVHRGNLTYFVENDQVCQVYWDCPYSDDNKLGVSYVKNKLFPVVPAIPTTGSMANRQSHCSPLLERIEETGRGTRRAEDVRDLVLIEGSSTHIHLVVLYPDEAGIEPITTQAAMR